jgi:thiol-disulfide isomerase/thioredoxin
MKVRFLLLFLIPLVCKNITAKGGYTITANIKNNTDTVLYLAHYYAKPQRVFKTDSAIVNANGDYVFKSDTLSGGGIYLLLNKKFVNIIEILLQDGDKFKLEFDRNEPVKTVKFTGSEENTNFYIYQNYLLELQTKIQAVAAELAIAKTSKDSLKINEKNIALGKEIKTYRNDFIKKHPNSLAATLFRDMEEPEIPASITAADAKRKRKKANPGEQTAYDYYKSNYWRVFDFKNDAVMYTPIYDRKLEDYFKLVLSIPDSFNKEADILLKQTRNSKELFKYTLNWLTYYAENSKVMGMDESFVYLVENYYMRGDAKPWQDSATLAKYVDRARAIAPNMIGQTAADIRVPDINEHMTSFREYCAKQDYTLLIFYDPTCGHCKKEIPASDSVVKQLRKKNIDIKIYGLENAQEDEKWKEFIKEKNLDSTYWLHVHDPNHIGGFRKNYDVRLNPVLYLINREGKIVGKRIDHSNLTSLITNLEKQRKNQL